MIRIVVPGDQAPVAYLWGNLAQDVAPSALAFGANVSGKSKLPLRLFEAVRIRVAQINGCEMCQSWRAHRDNIATLENYGMSLEESNLHDAEVPDEAFYAAIENWRDAPEFTERERVAIEFTDRYVQAPRDLKQDEDLWEQVHAHFTDDELADLVLAIGSWLALGRINSVLGVDDACQISSLYEDVAAAKATPQPA